jgi:hypothetical protein
MSEPTMPTSRLLPACFVASLSAALGAQFPCIVQDGNAAYTFNGPGTTCSTPGGTSNFAANAIDHLYQHWWWLSVDGAGPACTLNDLPIGNIVADCTGLAGRKATLRIADWDGSGKIRAVWDLWVGSSSATSGLVTSRMTLSNASVNPVTVRLFGYVDIDNSGAVGDTATPLAGWPAGNHVVTDSAQPPRAYVTARNYAHWEIGSYAALRTAIRNLMGTTPYTLADANNMSPVPGDHSSAFQWDATLAPGASTTAWIAVGIDREPPCQLLANAINYCTSKPGSNGVADWELAAQPFAGTSMPLTITNGLPGVSPIAVLGSGQTNFLLPPIGTLCVLPIALSFPLAPFGANRTSATLIPIPGNASVCGAMLYVQAFFPDAGAAGGIAHTDGLSLTVGSF